MTTRVIQSTVSLDQGLQLAQVRPSVTTPVAAYSPGEKIQTEVDIIYIANISDSVVEYQVFHDNSNSSFTPSTCIHIGEVQPRSTVELEHEIYIVEQVEVLAVQASIADTLTFTVYGRETQEGAR